MTITYIETNTNGRVYCPECGSNNCLVDRSDVDGIKLHTDPPSKPGNLGCNRCGHSWTQSA